MTAAALLDRLDGVKQTGSGRWLARCSAHEDRYASLSILQLGDDRVLLHCFAGCSTEPILAAIGLTWGDVFPPRAPAADAIRRERQPWLRSDVFNMVMHEALIVAIAGADIASGKALSEADLERVRVAVDRLNNIESNVYKRGRK